MLNLFKVSLVTVGIVSNVCGATSTDPITTGNEPISQSGQKEAAWNTQAYLEEMLIKQGALQPGEHLAPHEVWELVDILKARINARRILQAR